MKPYSLYAAMAALFFASGCAFQADTSGISLQTPFSPAPKAKTFGFDPNDVKMLAVVGDESRPNRKAKYEDAENQADQAVEQEFIQAFLEKGYPVISRSKVNAVIKEIGFQNSGLTEAENSEKLGKMLNVSHLLVCSGSAQGDRVQRQDLSGRRSSAIAFKANIQTQLIEVSTGRIVAANSDSMSMDGTGLGDAIEITRKLAKRIASGYPSRVAPAKK